MSALRAVENTAKDIDVVSCRDDQDKDHDDAQDALQPGGVVVDAARLKLPVAPHSQVPAGESDPAVWLVGAHGGAGVSTLACVGSDGRYRSAVATCGAIDVLCGGVSVYRDGFRRCP